MVWLIIFCFAFTIIPGRLVVEAATLPAQIRIGVVQDCSSIDFSSKQGSYKIVDENTGQSIVNLAINGELYRAQIDCNLSRIELFRYVGVSGKAAPASAGSTTTTGNQDNRAEVDIENQRDSETDQLKVESEKAASVVGGWESKGTFKGPLRMVNIGLNQTSTTKPSLVQCESRLYRGQLEIRINASRNGLTGINELPFEEYLFGVVAREMSGSWPQEALKAQAIIARTYAARNLSRHSSEGYNLCGGSNCQIYGGYDYEAESCTRAVQETNGQVVVDNQGQLAITLYHSNSGGYTENNVNVFGADLYYLQGRSDPYSLGRGLSDWRYITVVNGKNDRNEDGLRNLLLKENSNLGLIESINLEKYVSGRVKTVIIQDDRGNNINMTGGIFGSLFNRNYAVVGKDKVMGRLFDITTDATFTMLNGKGEKVTQHGGIRRLVAASSQGLEQGLSGVESNYYVVGADGKYVRSKNPTTIDIQGHGWGHGVGLSQWGAYEMAYQGFKHKEIVEFYYPGTRVNEW
jgi:stage II sporulation protein D